MTKLIDADALLMAIATRTTTINSKNINKNEMLDLITNAPTVEREGWVSVPIVPTEEMIDAGRTQGRNNELEFRHKDEGTKLVYKAMLSAAQKE